jgi:hypothetical protein
MTHQTLCFASSYSPHAHKCEVPGCKDELDEFSCPVVRKGKDGLYLIGLCGKHWKNICDRNRWDYGITRCCNEKCDILRINLTGRQSFNPHDLAKYLNCVPKRIKPMDLSDQ